MAMVSREDIWKLSCDLAEEEGERELYLCMAETIEHRLQQDSESFFEAWFQQYGVCHDGDPQGKAG